MPRRKPSEICKVFGFEGLSDSELVALIIGTGTRRQSVYSIAREVTVALDSTRYSENLPTEDFINNLSNRIPKGESYRNTIGALYELIHRYNTVSSNIKREFKSPGDLIKAEFQMLGKKSQEYVYGIYLSSRLTIKRKVMVSKGSLDYAVIEPQDILFHAIKCKSRNVIIVHNHPSGDPSPSKEDILITRKLKFAAELLNINLLDHIIVSNNGFYSFHQSKLVL